MTFHYAQIAQRLFNVPLLYDDVKAEAFLHGLGSRIAGDTIVVTNPVGFPAELSEQIAKSHFGVVGNRLETSIQRNSMQPFSVHNGVAIIEIEGTLVHKGGWIGNNSGSTSYQGLQAQIAIATKSPEVKAVVFEVDCYGGEVNGAFETAAAIARLSRQKPTLAILTDHAYSGGYLLASQARSIIVPRHGGAGSIGVVKIHADHSRQIESEGIRLTIIRAGANKMAANQMEPLPDDIREKWTLQAEELRNEFAEVVASARKGRITKAKVMATEAATYTASEALELGLVDGIGDPNEAFDAFVSDVNRSRK